MSRPRSFAALALSGLLLLHAALAPLAEANVWHDRRSVGLPTKPVLPGLPPAGRLAFSGAVPKLSGGSLSALPSRLARIRKIIPAVGRESGVVLLMQDLHANDEAQSNISALLTMLAGGANPPVLALEGAAGRLPVSALRRFPAPKSIAAVADWMLARHRISGAAHAAITAPADFADVIGVDDADAYAANVSAYREAAPQRAAFTAAVAERLGAHERRARARLNPALLEAVQAVRGYRAHRTPLSDHVAYLLSRPESSGPSAALRDLVSALELEKNLVFPSIEQERAAFFSRLVQSGSADRLMSLALDYRSGAIGHAAFYDAIRGVGAARGVDLGSYPAFAAYVRYAAMVDRIDIEKVSEGVSALEADLVGRRTRSGSERRFIEEWRHLDLLESLGRFALTPADWAEYRRVAAGLAARNADTTRLRVPPAMESFYVEAGVRDAKLAQNTMAAMRRASARAAVLVAGGFHSDGVAARLSRAGFRVVVASPRVTQIDAATASDYLSVFLVDTSPLEKLFEGVRLHLASPPLSDSAAVVIESGAVLHARIVDGNRDAAGELAAASGVDISDIRPVDGGATGRLSIRGVPAAEIQVDIEGTAVRNIGTRSEAPSAGLGRVWSVVTSIFRRLLPRAESAPTLPALEGAIEQVVSELRRAGRNAEAAHLEAAYADVVNHNEEFRLLRPLIRLSADAPALAAVSGNVLVLDPEILGNQRLLSMELREEFRHLAFRHWMRSLWSQAPSEQEEACEELYTDFSKIHEFARMSHAARVEVIRYLGQHYGAQPFIELLVAFLPNRDYDALVGALRSSGLEPDVMSLVERPAARHPIKDLTREVVRGEDVDIILRALVSFYQTHRPYDRFEEYFSKPFDTIRGDLDSYITVYDAVRDEVLRHEPAHASIALGHDFAFQPVDSGPTAILTADGRGGDLVAFEDIVASLKDKRKVAIAQPHPDDVVFSMGALLKNAIAKRIFRNVTLINVNADHLGVSDSYVNTKWRRDHQATGLEQVLETEVMDGAKRTIRGQEERTVLRDSFGLGNANYVDLEIDMPLAQPQTLAERGLDVPPSTTDELVAALGARKFEEIRRAVETHSDAEVWFIPYPFLHTKHHTHHELTALAFLRCLRDIGYEGVIVFYETWEAETSFEDENRAREMQGLPPLSPSFIYAYGDDEAADKQKAIEGYESQNLRRNERQPGSGYDVIVPERHRKKGADEQQARVRASQGGTRVPVAIRSAERFIAGRLVSTPPKPGTWPFLEKFYALFGGGLLGRAFVPTLIESTSFVGGLTIAVAAVAGVPVVSVEFFLIFLAFKTAWALLHGADAFAPGRREIFVSTILAAAAVLLLGGLLGLPDGVVITGFLIAASTPHLVVNAVLGARERRLARALAAAVDARRSGSYDRDIEAALAAELAAALPLSLLRADDAASFSLPLFEQAWREAAPRNDGGRAVSVSEISRLLTGDLARVEAAEAVQEEGEEILIPVPAGLSRDALAALLLPAVAAARAGRGPRVRAVVSGADRAARDRTAADVREQLSGVTSLDIVTDTEGGVLRGEVLSLGALERALGPLRQVGPRARVLMADGWRVDASDLGRDSTLRSAVFTIINLLEETARSTDLNRLEMIAIVARMAAQQA